MDEQEKNTQGLSDAARRRAEDAIKARELRKQALAELEEEDKRRAAELLQAGTGKETAAEEKTSEPEREEVRKFLDASALLAEDPKAGTRALLEAKGVEKEDLDAYAQSESSNPQLDRLFEAYGGREAYRENIAEPSARSLVDAERNLKKLSMTDVSEMTVGVRRYYKAEAAKAKKEKDAENARIWDLILLRVPAPVGKLVQHLLAVIGIWILGQPDPKRPWVLGAMIVALIVYLALYGFQGGLLGKKQEDRKIRLTPMLLSGGVLFFLEETIRNWLWYSWISGEFYRLLCMVLMGIFVVFGCAIILAAGGITETVPVVLTRRKK